MEVKAAKKIFQIRAQLSLLLPALLLVLFGYILGQSSNRSWEKLHWNHHDDHWWEFWEDDEHHFDRYRDRRSVSPSRIKALEAQKIVARTIPQWSVAKGWQREIQGQIELMVPLKYNKRIIGEINIDPARGTVEPHQVRVPARLTTVGTEQAQNIAQSILGQLTAGNRVRRGRHGNYWEVPLLYKGLELEEIMVGVGTGQILPDWDIEEEIYSDHF